LDLCGDATQAAIDAHCQGAGTCQQRGRAGGQQDDLAGDPVCAHRQRVASDA
ncbi:unnamed protein product, partial [Effrenium voratum]